ncbi:MAG: ABC transporter ATP-binding protein [Candidatus Methylacidiphilales bacterium]|nr:ABC transporter ATP-binding protein [Candidatus Methylacidiphilales bacterium]
MNAVHLDKVCKHLGGAEVVRSVDLEIRRGEFFSLLGPSGCGKSTTLRLIAGFDRPSSGRISINGKPINGVPAYVHDINLVFQNYALFPHLTVFQNVAFGLEMQKKNPADILAAVTEILALVRLSGMDQRLPRELSGGQQQRVALARALVTRPSVVLLDEPLGALDLKLRKEMQFELKQLQSTLGLTFIYVTHDQEEALTMSDRIAVMHKGRVLQVGTPEEIYEKPATRFVADFIGESNFFEGTIVSRDGKYVVFASSGLNIKVFPDHVTTPGPEGILAVRPEKIWIGKNRAAGMENVFAAHIVDSLYYGTDTLFLVKLDKGPSLQVRRQNLKETGIGKGDAVFVGWPDESAYLLESAAD